MNDVDRCQDRNLDDRWTINVPPSGQTVVQRLFLIASGMYSTDLLINRMATSFSMTVLPASIICCYTG